MFDVGSIVINRNIFFKDANKLDHAYKKGRPCLVIALNDEYYYYLSISNSIRKDDKTNLPIEYCTKLSSPSFKNVFRAPICYKEEKFKLSTKKMLDIYIQFIKYYENREKCEYYTEVIEYITNYINQNEKSMH